MYSPVTIRVPDIQKCYLNYCNASTKRANIKMIQDINKNYGSTIAYWGRIFDIPAGIIIGFIATESGGKMLAPNRYKATGLMQVTPAAIFDCARKWTAEVRSPLPSVASAELKKKIPNFFTGSLSSMESKLLLYLKTDANFNIMSGTLVLRWLIERFSVDGGTGQLNKAMVAYNAGAYLGALGGVRANTTPIDSTSLANNRRVPLESRNYLIKTLGKDGFFSLIYKDKAI